MPSKYRPVSTAEKKLLLAEPGEWSEAYPPPTDWYPVAWPIGSDGLPKIWLRKEKYSFGGTWGLRGNARATQSRCRAKHRGSRTYPLNDRTSTKYPTRTFYRGQWLTPWAIKRRREQGRKRTSDPAFRERELIRIQEYKSELIANQKCRDCTQALDCESNSRCWSCLDKQKERR